MWNFRELRIWQEGKTVTKLCYDYCNQLPLEERFNLVSQIQRAAVSIPANIAEGASRSTIRDFGRYLEIALGSCFEIETLLELSMELHSANDAKANNVLMKLTILEKQINRMKSKLSLKFSQSTIPNPQLPE